MKKKTILKNGMMGIVSQITKIVFTFLTRSLFIKYIGKELLGLNSTFTSVLSTLAVTELGFQTAVAYSLYKPIHDGNREEINDIMNIFKIVYRCIGIFFLAASLILLPFLKYIIKGIEVNSAVWIYFLLQAAASSCTYFLAYKRTILYADQKEYISKSIDMIINIVFNILQCITLVWLKSYGFYLILRIAQAYISNIFVHLFCLRRYDYLHSDKFNIIKFKEIFGKVKSVFAARIAGYIYSSTDNIVISTFVSTISVGLLVNYTTITTSLKALTNSLLNPMTPIVGNYLVEEHGGAGRKRVFDLYAHIMFLIALCTVIPLLVLIDDFITWWIGNDMVMNRVIPLLISADYYIHLVHGCLNEFINGGGFFREDRNVEIIGALCNITTSLILVQFLGIPGVLIGTVISQMVFWIGRSRIVFLKCLDQDKRGYINYWLRNLLYFLLFIVLYVICTFIYTHINIENSILKVVAGGCICEMLAIFVVLTVFAKMPEQKKIISIFSETIKQKLAK